MNFLVFPYNAVLNAGVFDDAVVADGHVWADGAVFDDYVLADVARGGECQGFFAKIVCSNIRSRLIIPERRSRQSGEVRATSPV